MFEIIALLGLFALIIFQEVNHRKQFKELTGRTMAGKELFPKIDLNEIMKSDSTGEDLTEDSPIPLPPNYKIVFREDLGGELTDSSPTTPVEGAAKASK